MTDPDFPDELCSFIQRHVPSVEAVEVLLFLARRPERGWTPADVCEQLRPSIVKEAEARRHLDMFTADRLAGHGAEDTYRFSPHTPAMAAAVAALARAYNERPVTLVRLIYALREPKIQSFADAFRLKKD
jgi:hypothetical protein